MLPSLSRPRPPSWPVREWDLQTLAARSKMTAYLIFISFPPTQRIEEQLSAFRLGRHRLDCLQAMLKVAMAYLSLPVISDYRHMNRSAAAMLLMSRLVACRNQNVSTSAPFGHGSVTNTCLLSDRLDQGSCQTRKEPVKGLGRLSGDRKLADEKRSQLDRLYQSVTNDLDDSSPQDRGTADQSYNGALQICRRGINKSALAGSRNATSAPQ